MATIGFVSVAQRFLSRPQNSVERPNNHDAIRRVAQSSLREGTCTQRDETRQEKAVSRVSYRQNQIFNFRRAYSDGSGGYRGEEFQRAEWSGGGGEKGRRGCFRLSTIFHIPLPRTTIPPVSPHLPHWRGRHCRTGCGASRLGRSSRGYTCPPYKRKKK